MSSVAESSNLVGYISDNNGNEMATITHTASSHEPTNVKNAESVFVSAAAEASVSPNRADRGDVSAVKAPPTAVVPMNQHAPPAASGSKHHDGLVIYVAPKCPFCMRVKGLFTAYGVEPRLIDSTLDSEREGYLEAVKKYEHYTVPLVLYKDRLIGGCDDVCALIERGELPRLLDLPINHAKPARGTTADGKPLPRRDLVSPCLFNFPPLVDNKVVRVTGLLTMIMSIILIVFRKDEWAWWVSLGMAVDFLIRFMFGGTPSVLGSLAVAIVAPFEEELVPGPPKQFAAFVGLCFYSAICAVFISGDGRYGTEIAASILLGIIAFFAFLESFLNFCAGCFVFGYMVSFGIVRNTIYQPYTDSYEYTKYAVTEWNTKTGWVEASKVESEEGGPLVEEGEEAALSKRSIGWRRRWLVNSRFRPAHKPVLQQVKVSEAHHFGSADEQTTVVDIHYKFPKTEETSREKWSYKYLSVTDFASCMGSAGFALMCKEAGFVFWVPTALWAFFAIFAGVHFSFFLLCMIGKLIFHPKKIFMELENPMKRNASGIIPIVFCIFSLLVRDKSHAFALVLFWIGCPFVVINLVVQMAYLIRNRHGMSAFTPTNLVAPLGLFVLSINISELSKRMDHAANAAWAHESAKFFWGAALLFFIVLFTASVYVGVLFHWGPDKMRPAIVIWMGASFICTCAYLMIFNPPEFDAFAYVFFSSGFVLYLTVLYLIYPGNWLMRGRFDMANWGASFPLSVFGVAATLYYQYQQHSFAQALCWIGYASSGYANFTCLFHTVRLLTQRKWPGPQPECNPLMFNKFVSDSLIELSARLKADAIETSAASAEAEANEGAPSAPTPNANIRLLDLTAFYLRVLKTVLQYNVDIMLPEFVAVNKRQTEVAFEQHKWSFEQVAALSEMCAKGDTAGLRAALPSFIDTQYDNLTWMQDHLGPLMMKGMNQRIGMVILERIWTRVPKDELQEVVTTTFRYSAKQMYRTMFLKAITSSLPERCQQIGRWLFIDAVKDPLGDIKLSMMYDDIPEIIPKGMGISWTRQS